MPDYNQRERWEKAAAIALLLLFRKWYRPALSDLFDPIAFTEAGVPPFADALNRPYTTGGRTLSKQFGFKLPPNMATGRWAEAYAKRFIKELGANIAADLRGLGVDASAADVAQVLSKSRAARGGVTSVTTAISAGELDAADVIEKTNGSKLQVRWVISSGNVCPVCRKLSGTLKRKWSLKFPAGPPAHPGCNCHLEFA